MADQQAVAVLVGGDAAAFEQLLQMLMSTQNEQRAAAEAVLAELKKHPDACVTHLIRSLRNSPSLEARSLAAVLLRRALTKDDPSLFPALSPAVEALVKAETLACLRAETLTAITHKVCDTVAELGAVLVEDGRWPELLPFMFSAVQSGQERLAESALRIFEQLARYVMDVLASHLGTLHGVLAAALAAPSLDVRLAALRATSAFVLGIVSAADRDKFQSLLPAALAVLGGALNAGEEPAARDAIEALIEVAEEHPRFLRRQLAAVVDAMLQVAGSEDLDESTRRMAAELLMTLCEAREKAPGMMRRLPTFAERVFGCAMGFLLDIEDAPEWHAAVDERDEGAGEGELYEFGQECLDRLALSLGGKALAPVAGAALPAWLGDADWRKRHAALVCLAQIAEGCARVMAEQTSALVALCLRGASDPHARVRWAACQAAGQLCTDLGPGLQEEHHAALMPALVGLMGDAANPRVQAHACAATVNFAEGCDQDTVAPYMDGLVTALIALLQGGRRNVQEGALTAIASVADAAQDYFVAYYDRVMPLLRAVMEQASGRELALMRAKALECVSLVGMAVGRERFAADADAVMRYMAALTAAGLDPDDPLPSYMLQAGARVCKTLGQGFLPYLPSVMPPVLAAARAKPDVMVRAADGGGGGSDAGGSGGDDDDGADIEHFFVGDKRVSLHTSVLEEKASACQMLCCYAYELREGFFPYAEEVTGVMVPLLKFYFNEDVRMSAAQTLPELLRCAVLARAAGAQPAATDEFVRSMLAFMWGPLVVAVREEAETEVLCVLIESVEEVVEIAAGVPGLLPAAELAPLFEAFATVLSDYEERRAERLERTRGEDFDAEEAEALEEEHEAESSLLDALGNVVTQVLRAHGDAAMPLVEGLMPAVARLLEAGRFPEERRAAICLMDDVLEHSPAGAAKYMGQVLPLLLAGVADRDVGVRQCCAYGLGQAAARRGEAFAPHAPAALAALLAVVRAPGARSEEAEPATDNAVSALLKLLEHHPAAAAAEPGLGALVVAYLPMTGDAVEAKAIHAQLLRLVQRSDARVLGDGNALLPRLVEVFVKVLAKGDKLVEPPVAAEMAALLRQMQAALPADVFAGFVSALKPKQQQTLQAVLAGAEGGKPA